MAITAGVANVLVVPSFAGFQAAVGKQVSATMPAAGRQAGTLFSQGMAQGISAGSGGIKAAAAAATYGTTASATAAGRAAGTGFVSGVAGGMRAGVASASASTTTMFAPATQIAGAAGASAGRAFITGARTAMIGGTGAFAAAGATAAIGPARQITAAGAGAGSGFMSRAGSALSSGASAVRGAAAGIGARMSAAIAGAGTAAGTGFLTSMTRSLGPLAAILGPAAILGSGWNRFANIEDAQNRLAGLGYSADVIEETMDNALASVEGTSFYLDQAAGTATTMLAAGVEPGQELEDILRLVGDAAYIAGTDFAEMGSIFGQVAASDMVQGDTFNRLLDRSLPILSFLADELGVTEAEVRSLGSAGEISFADFAAAMESGLGGAATAGERTVRNMLADTSAAIMSFGASVVEWMRPGIEAVTDALTGFFGWATDGFEAFVEWGKENQEWLLPLAAGIGAIAASVTAVAVATWAASAAVTAFSKVWTLFNTTFGKTPWGRVIFLIIGLVTALVVAYQTSDTARGIISTAWNFIKDSVERVVNWFTGTALPFMQAVWEGISSGATWLWESVLQPVWGFIKAAWDGLMTGINWAWENILKPAWDGISAAAQWLWGILSPIFSAIGSTFAAIGGWIFDVWYNVIKLAWDALVYAAQWMWNSILRPIFGHIRTAWDAMASAMRWAWNNILKPVWDALQSAAQWMWRNVLRPVFDRIGNAWRGMVDGIRWAWRNILKPVWDTVAGFVEDTILPGVERGIELIDSAWRAIANLFRAPINWVINTVWNDGLKAAFDNVAEAINSDARLPEAPTIPRFAEGGLAQPGWAIVGEEGPELVNFTAPARVYTASETAGMLARGGPGTGGDFSETHPPDGGIASAASSAVSWVRGGLASLADTLLSPIFDTVSNTVSRWGPVGELGGDAMTNAKDQLVDWIRGEDDVMKGVLGPGFKESGAAGAIRGATAAMNAAAWNIWNAIPGLRGMHSLTSSMVGPHKTGNAVDFYGPSNALAATAAYAASNAAQLGIRQVIYNWRLWQGGGWGRLGSTGGNDPGHVWHVHVASHGGGARMWDAPRHIGRPGVYDDGGMLLHGQTALNLSRKPEAVLTNKQWADVHTLIHDRAAGGDTWNLYGIPMDHAKQTADEIMHAQRVHRRGSAYSRSLS